MKFRTNRFLIFFIPYFILYLISAHNALFWDTVQFAGDHPNWYYSTHFHHFLLPDSCDSGHPPTFGIYLAFLWEIFGRSLFVSHTAMLPFVALIVWQAIRLGDLLFPHQQRKAFLITLILLSESILLSQCTLVSPDIWLIGFFLLGLNAILSRARLQQVIAIIFLGLISTRGMMCAFTLYIFALSYNYNASARGLIGWATFKFKTVLPFLPGAGIAMLYLGYHYLVKGWIGYHKASPWAAGFEIMPLKRIAFNNIVLIWRLVDLGEIATILTFIWVLLAWLFKKIVFQNSGDRIIARSLILLILAQFAFTAFPLTFYQGLLTHRYLLPLLLTIGAFTTFLVLHAPFRRKKMIIGIMFLVQCSGHFWTYPEHMSQGWEGTLGHLFFYGMRNDFKQYMAGHHIEKQDVATSPTLMQSDYRIDVTEDTTAYKDAEIDSSKYVWYCNTSNAMNKSVDYYYRNFKIIKQEKKGNVIMVLFKRPDGL